MQHRIDFNYFPGYTRKSISFTIDDGNITWDTVFLDIVRRGGIRGTFNLCHVESLSPEEYRRMYDGYEIANHVYRHPLVMTESFLEYSRSVERYDPKTAVQGVLHATDVDGLFCFLCNRGYGQNVAETDTYLSLTDRMTEDLRGVFGEEAARGFVWPYSEQPNEELKARLRARGFAYMRKTGNVLSSTGFAFPADRMAWSYNTDDRHLLSCAAEYAAYPDDGELKFFAFGVHSVDFERDGLWDDLKRFCELYGNRPSEFYSAPVIELFRYEDAVRSLSVEDDRVENLSDVTLYGTVDGERVVLPPHAVLRLT